jgi:excisionase family DNA binding protein
MKSTDRDSIRPGFPTQPNPMPRILTSLPNSSPSEGEALSTLFAKAPGQTECERQPRESRRPLGGSLESIAKENDPTMRPLAVDLNEAARLTSVSKFTLRRRIKDGRLKATRCGNRYIVPLAVLERFVNGE